MKALSRPISSPSRADKFPVPPPLMRFLRTNIGSRSRSTRRSRSSPLFYLRSKKTLTHHQTTTQEQEPSSPKVTCFGQVKVNHQSKKTTSARNKLSSRIGRFLGKWGLFFRCKKVDTTTEEDSFGVCTDEKSVKIGTLIGINEIDADFIVTDGKNKRDFVGSSSCFTPKNALLLTRCSSAPYRSSSLGARFCGSPLNKRDKETEESEAKLEELQSVNCRETEDEAKSEELHENEAKSEELHENEAESEELKNPSCGNVVLELIIREESGKVFEENVEELEGTAGVALHSMLLTRCKSEPARTGERLFSPEANFWKQEELALADSRSTSRCSSFEYEDDDDFNDSEYSNFNFDYINAPHSIVIKSPIANNRPSSQKAVIKIDMIDPKTRKKAMKIAARLSGVESVAATGERKNELVVTGNGMDYVQLVLLLRKKVGFTEIVSVSKV